MDLIVFGLLIMVIVIKQPAGITGIVRDISRRFGRRPAAAKGGPSLTLLDVREVSKKFGELVANDRGELRRRPRGHSRADRAQRRRQDDALQLHLRPVRAQLRPGGFSTAWSITGLPSYRIARLGAVRTFRVVRPSRT